MAETLELPNGDVVGPDDVFLYNDYPYRLAWLDSEEYAFELRPLYWGDSGMDIPFHDREALVDQWGTDSRGSLDAAEWQAWLDSKRSDDRFADGELDAIARELPVDASPAGDDAERGLLAGVRDALGL